MRVNKRLLVAGIVVAGLAAAGGTAFTDANTYSGTALTVGYNSVTVSGGTIDSFSYATDSEDPPNVSTVTLVLDSAVTPPPTVTVELEDSGTPVDSSGWNSCTAGTVSTSTTYTCAITTGTSTNDDGTEPVADINSTDVLVNSNPS